MFTSNCTTNQQQVEVEEFEHKGCFTPDPERYGTAQRRAVPYGAARHRIRRRKRSRAAPDPAPSGAIRYRTAPCRIRCESTLSLPSDESTRSVACRRSILAPRLARSRPSWTRRSVGIIVSRRSAASLRPPRRAATLGSRGAGAGDDHDRN